MDTAPSPPPGDLFITPAVLHKIVMRLPKRKAPGPDGISTAALRHLPRRAIDPRKPENIRPITLLSHVAKTFERTLLIKLRLFLTPATGAILVLQWSFYNAVAHKSTTPPFIRKEQQAIYGGDTSLPPALTRVVTSFLQRRSFCVAIDDVLSASRPIRAGVPQSICLSPKLYALYTDDIPLLDHLEDWEDDVMLALYADDSAYFAPSRRADLAAKRNQRVCDLLAEWLDKWRMAVNVSKTAALLTGSQCIIMADQLRPRD
ncbi:RNA-directed DNA polymerase from mobile element jockey [Eumeta japonica]|uniref:RNA-directed DNA polymerase from mobile element jockey n=1 Tax=Eumeta variegata TaxID=151549 RepID=A0A4C1X350_EUMVA|nr:RNA-directed DNA polymerase from mobile element jockey [Eumeta japonica]